MLLLTAHVIQAFGLLTDYRAETEVAKALYLLEWNERFWWKRPRWRH